MESDPTWRATHVVNVEGLEARAQPAPSDAASDHLSAGVEVRVLESSGDWVRVDAANGWSGWVDGQGLHSLDGEFEELWAALDSAIMGYEALVGELEAGVIDDDEFRRRAFATGLVVRDGEAWMYDLSSGVWCRYDGIELAALGTEPEQSR